jgi:hypothetical protein
MAQTTYEVRLAVDGNHSVSVRGSDAAAMKGAIAWAKAMHAALAIRSEAVAEAQPEENEPPICGVHDVPMVRMAGKNGPFYSCHQRDADGRFCAYRPVNGA